MEEVAFAGAKWLWKQYGKDLVGKTILALKQKWKTFQWEDAEVLYRENLRTQHNTTRILGYPNPITIEGIFTDVYILNMLSSRQRFNLLELQSKPLERGNLEISQKRIPILQMLRNEKRLLILGKPGAGKTTLLKYLTLQACAGKIVTRSKWNQTIKTPIFVPLREWAESKLQLMDYIVKQFDICAFPDSEGFIKHMLKNGFAIVLFDGLDEIRDDDNHRSHTISELIEFANRYPNTQVCITCRIAATDFTFEQFSYVEVADFDENQIRLFIGKWYQQDKIKHDEFLKEFFKPEHLDLRELARTPLLLALICLAFDEMLSFPVRKVELFKESIDALLRKWDASRGIRRDIVYRNLSPLRKEQLLSDLATKNFVAGNYFISERVLAEQIQEFLQQLPSTGQGSAPDGHVILKAIESQHGVLIERSHEIYSFSHLTFQEYFTARYVVDNLSLGTLDELCRNYILDTRWYEVISLSVSLMHNADMFFKLALQTMHDLISNNQDFVYLLKWAKDKASLSKYPETLARAIFLFLALDILDIRLLNRKSDRFELTSSTKVSEEHDIYSAMNEVYNFALELTRFIFPKKIQEQNTTAKIQRTLSYKRAIDIAKTLGVSLQEVQIEREFNSRQLSRIPNLLVYLKINRLLIETLRLASVSDRGSIEKQILAPPPT